MATPEIALVLTTVPPEFDIEAFARTILEERLAACVSVFPAMRSTYRWEGRVEEADERQVLCKTTADKARRLTERVKSLHPYDVPELLVIRVEDAGEPYARWVGESVS